jgi:GH24 family phage-related lysozyme (muramidase)
LKNVKNLIYAYNKTHIKKDKESIENLVDKINEQISLKTEANATTLLNVKIQTYETALSKSLGKDNLLDSKERAAVISVIYNLTNATQEGIGKAIPSLITAIRNDNRAEAWYEIRYNTNGGDSKKKAGGGIANRRSSESNLFGLYDTLPPTADEAKKVIEMYLLHEKKITSEEKEFKAYEAYKDEYNNSIEKQLQPALAVLKKHEQTHGNTFQIDKKAISLDGIIKLLDDNSQKEKNKTDKTHKVAEISKESTLEELARTGLQRYGDNDIDVKYAKVVRAEIKEFEENRPKNDNDDSVHRVG